MANISEIKVQGTNYTLRGFENLVEVTSLAGLEANNFYLAKLSAPSDISFKNITSIGEHLRVIIIAQSDFELNWSDDVKAKYVFSNVNKIGFKTGDYALLDITCYPDQTYIYVSTNRFISELVYAEYTVNSGISTKLFNDTSNIEYIIIEATGEKVTEFGSAGSYMYQFNISGRTKVQVKFKAGATIDTNGIFNGCSDLVSISDKFLDLMPNITGLKSTFKNTSITSIPEGLFDNLSKLNNLSNCFENSKLETIPDGLIKSKSINNFNSMFENCINLKSPVPIDEDNTPIYNRGIYKRGYTYPMYLNCFLNCYNMRNYNVVPKLWGGPGSSLSTGYFCPAGFAEYGDLLLTDGTCLIIDKSSVFTSDVIPAALVDSIVGICVGGASLYEDGAARFMYCGTQSELLYSNDSATSRPWASDTTGITAIDASTDSMAVLETINGQEINNKILASDWASKASAVKKCNNLESVMGEKWYLPAAGEIHKSWSYEDPNPSLDPSRIIAEVMSQLFQKRYGSSFYFHYGQWSSSAWTVNMYDNTKVYTYIYRKPGMVYQADMKDSSVMTYIYPFLKLDKSNKNSDYINGNILPGEASIGDLLLKNGTCLTKYAYNDDYKDQVLGICVSENSDTFDNQSLFVYVGKDIIKTAWSSELLDSVAPPSSGDDYDMSGPQNTNSVLDSGNLDKYTAYIKVLELGYMKDSIYPRLDGDDGHWFLPSSLFFQSRTDGLFSRDCFEAVKATIEHLNNVSGEGSFADPFVTGNKFWLSMQNSDKQPYYIELAESSVNSQVSKGVYSDSYIICPMVMMNTHIKHSSTKDSIIINYNNTLGTAARGYLDIYGGSDFIYSGALGLFTQTTINAECSPNSYVTAKVRDTGGAGISNVTINGYTMQADKSQGLGNSYNGFTINVTVK